MRTAIALTFALVSLTAADAGAQDQTPPPFGENPPPSYHSPQRFAFELKFGPYSPNIDASPGLNGKHPFADLFYPQGGGKRPPGRLLTQIEFDYEFWHARFGTFGVGHTAGFYRRSTHALEYNQVNGMDVPCDNTPANPCVASGDMTTLTVIPLSLMAVYRFDTLAERWRIPFVPYFKIGLAYYAWWIENAQGFAKPAQYTPPGGKPESGFGGTLGWVMNPGGAFLLDVLDPSAARTIDSELGINHTFLFCELHYADISGFGAAGKMNLSDTTLNAGIAFEF